MKKSKRMLALLFATALVIGLVGCGGSGTEATQAPATAAPAETKADAPAAAPAPAAATTDQRTFVIGVATEPESIAPGGNSKSNSLMVSAMCYDQLLGKDPENQSTMVPNIASEWEFEGTEILLTIRDDIKFHDGTPLTVDDVVYSFEYDMEQPANSTLATVFKGIEKVDDTHVKITLEYAYKPALQILAAPGFGIFSKAFHEKCQADGTNFNMVENGTGAYILTDWIRGDKMVFKANDNWHRLTPAIKTVELHPVPDETSGGLMIESGEIDFFVGPNAADYDRFEANPDVTLLKPPSMGTQLLTMNIDHGVFSDNLALREAVAYAINREELLVAGQNGYGKVTPYIVTPGYFGYVDDFEPYPYDLEKAKEKMIEAGYPDGLTVTFKTPSDSWYKDPAIAAAEQLRQIGINCEMQIMERAAYLEEVQEKLDYELCWYMSWGDYQDADCSVWAKFHSSSIGKQLQNWAGVNDPEVDALLEQARSSLDDNERIECYRKIAEINKENAWYMYIYTGFNTAVIRSDIKNVHEISTALYNPGFWSF